MNRLASLLALSAGLTAAPFVHAAVQSIDATTTAQVVEAAGPNPQSDFAFKDLSDTATTLPLIAEARLLSADASFPASAAARTALADPRLSALPDPAEFTLDVAAFSTPGSVPYTGKSEATETREITFTSEEIGAPDGSSLMAESQFFLDGLVLLWADPDSPDLSATSADFTITIEQTWPGAASPEVVFSATFAAAGNADGTAAITADGKLAAENFSVLSFDGSDGSGPLHLIVIPNLGIPYTYEAVVGEPFSLRATVRSNIRNQAGSGAAISLGTPLSQLGSVLAALAGVDSEFAAFLQDAAGSAPPPLKPLPRSPAPTKIRLVSRPLSLFPFNCGAAGAEAALLAAGWGAWLCLRRR